MPATFGVTQLFGFSAPAGCVVKEATVKESIDNLKYRNEVGTTIRNIPGKMITSEQTIELTGVAPLSLLTPGAFTSGQWKAVRVRNRESNNGVPESTVVRKKYSTRS